MALILLRPFLPNLSLHGSVNAGRTGIITHHLMSGGLGVCMTDAELRADAGDGPLPPTEASDREQSNGDEDPHQDPNQDAAHPSVPGSVRISLQPFVLHVDPLCNAPQSSDALGADRVD